MAGLENLTQTYNPSDEAVCERYRLWSPREHRMERSYLARGDARRLRSAGWELYCACSSRYSWNRCLLCLTSPATSKITAGVAKPGHDCAGHSRFKESG